MRWFRRKKPKHVHHWYRAGYGGAGWYIYRCSLCNAEEIG